MARILILLIVVSCMSRNFTVTSPAIDCKPGGHGSNCRPHNSSQDGPGDSCHDEGRCLNSSCYPGWFGSKCQYLDLIHQRNRNKSYHVYKNIIDNDEKTCATKHNLTHVTVTWTTAFLFSWLRVYVHKPKLLQEIEVEFTTMNNKTVQCENQRSSFVSQKSRDIHCDINETVIRVNLTGRGVAHLCSLHISGGQKLKLPIARFENKNSAKNTTQECESHMVKPKWHLCSFGGPMVVRYFFQNRSGAAQPKGMIMMNTTDNNDGNVVLNYFYKNKMQISRAIVIGPSINMSKIILINIVLQVTNNREELKLCQVGAYGDSLCNPGRYGPNCEYSCNCAQENETCFVSTGGCPSGCAVGYQGEACSKPCNQGYFGANCGSTCSQFCLVRDNSVCHHINGTCSHGCQKGYAGHMCLQEKSLFSEAEAAGLVVGVMIGAILVTLVVVVFLNLNPAWLMSRCNKVKDKGNVLESDSSGGGYSKANETILQGGETGGGSTQRQYDTVNDQRCWIHSATAIAISDLGGFLASHDRSFFQQQFKAIPHNKGATTMAAQCPQNKNKNRYKNVYPYDHSRVKLQVDEEINLGDYINASYIQSYTPEEIFIATQGPTKATLEDFVRMLWETQTDVVVMLTNFIENDKRKCERYWSEDDRMTCGQIDISVSSVQVFADYTIRRLHLRQFSQEGGLELTITHFHFPSWPDRDIPTTLWALLDFEQTVSSYLTRKPVIVHCSAGIGRTGTFIALHNVMRQAQDTGFVDCFTVVKNLRQDRICMVQTQQQYEFLHQAAQVATLCMGPAMTCRNFETRLKMLETRVDSSQTNMDREFWMVCALSAEQVHKESEFNSSKGVYVNCTSATQDVYVNCMSASQGVYENCRAPDQKIKNRFSYILARESYRAVLEPELEGQDDYINAILVPSLRKANHQILTQLPLPATTTDFWRLVTQYHVTLIVVFEADGDTADMSLGDYLPADNQAAVFTFLNISVEPVACDSLWEEQAVTINTDTKVALNINFVVEGGHFVTHLKCITSDLDPQKLLALAMKVRSLRPEGEGCTLYMCRNGADYSGLMFVLTLLLDRMDNDQCLTVPLVVGAIKAIRPQVIPTLEQYRLLYHALKLYSDMTRVYSNSSFFQTSP